MPDIAQGPFEGKMESLAGYVCPEWFRDAKFGIWAHWGPQAVPMAGDWYARKMYQQGDAAYQWHVEHYGHPSLFGYKDIIPMWKAEKFDPDRLMALYQRAGARYFVSMGVHHDNFDLWDSAHNQWNAVKMGPRRDIVKAWQDAARKHGLKFGVSEHLGASFTWFQDSHRADKEGPKAGVPYDGADPRWQDLYHFPAEPGDTDWYSKDPRWHLTWFARIRDLLDRYRPDLLYTDGGVPFGNETGLAMIAHLYNSDAARHGGKCEGVYTCKQDGANRWIEDMERGVLKGIKPDPWQTDTSIGDWYYNRNWKFRPVSWVIHMLADIVSKNGNLLLNVVQRPDGSLDPEVETMLGKLGDWMAVHGEAIYGTRPWLVYGEGATRVRGGAFKEDFAYSARDIRFTTKAGTLYAIALGRPSDGTLTIRSLADHAGGGTVTGVSLLGSTAKLSWKRDGTGLAVKLPATGVSAVALVLCIKGEGLKPAPVEVKAEPVGAGPDGVFLLVPDTAVLDGDQIREEKRGGKPNIGYWDRADERVEWAADVKRPGSFRVEIEAGGPNRTVFAVEVGGRPLTAEAPVTGSWDRPGLVTAGTVEIAKAGPCVVRVGAKDPAAWRAVNLWSLRLIPAGSMQGDELKSLEKSSAVFKSLDGVRADELGLSEEDMAWWRDAKFGMFIHWGLYAIPARGEWVMHSEKIPAEEYAKLADRFTPGHFDARAWAKTAKDAGMKYMVMVARHHDGFALWDSPGSYRDFTSVKTAAHRDFVKEYAAGCRASGLRVGLYYSPLDWRFPGYFKPRELSESAALLKKQGYAQVEELMKNYGKIDILWYDGGWLAHTGTDADAAWFWEPVKLNTMVRRLQSKVVINPRSGWIGDFQCDEGSHAIGGPIIPRPWEKCLNLNDTAWGYTERQNLLSLDYIITTLVNVVCRDGNVLLNVGPDADGVIPAAHVTRLREVGHWLETNGEAVFGTRAGPFQPVDGAYGSTQRGKKVYLHILRWPEGGKPLVLPPLPGRRIASVGTLGKGHAEVTQTRDGISVTVPESARSAPVTVVVLEIS